MEESHGSECSKANLSDQNKDRVRNSTEGNEDESKPTNGRSSSSSTVEENEKKASVRRYVRSKLPRLRWTPDLHNRFVLAIQRLGGQDRATPKLVLQLMNIKGLSIAHVKSHLQMYRSKKTDDPDQVHRPLVEDGDHKILSNLSQLPIIQRYNQIHSNLRYADTSWGGCDKLMMHRTFVGRNSMGESQAGCCLRMFGKSNFSWSNGNVVMGSCSIDGHSIRSITQGSKEKLLSFDTDNRPLLAQGLPCFRDTALSDINSGTGLQDQTVLKRKTWNCELDLDLSLGPIRRNNNVVDDGKNLEDNEIDSNLSLSLYSSTSNVSICRSKEEQGNVKEHAGKASTLDLTI